MFAFREVTSLDSAQQDLEIMSDFPDYEDESFPPLPPPVSPGEGGQEDRELFTNGEGGEEGDVSKLAEVPAAKRKGVKRPQPKLDSNRLISERGLPALRTLFDNVSFKGNGHEVENLRLLMQKMENWAHRLYPKMQFEDFMDKVEKLGSKKEVQTCLKRIRLDMPLTHEDFTGEEEAPPELQVFEDPFSREDFLNDLQAPISSTPAAVGPQRSPGPPAAPALTEEQLRRMELNRRLALERKLARHQQETDSQTVSTSSLEVEPSLVPSGNVDGSTDQDEKMEDLQPTNNNTQQQTEEPEEEEPNQPPITDSEPPQTEEEEPNQPPITDSEPPQTEEEPKEEEEPNQPPNTDSEPPQTEEEEPNQPPITDSEPPQTEEPKPELQEDEQ
ncbi:TIMELESS-interacting protein isoform X2 [Acanthochromis polyacanthus]|uniref:TIMELESS-interacting protein isoform X2 n=1 Tax=Acanthochromis polyacanthus TaxID=80966 RepID=UPI002234DACC|nr:TIMELESS-interacting protein isoform X2 [Acanthochromis polyacanthus]